MSITVANWFDDWDTKLLYQALVLDSTTAPAVPPIPPVGLVVGPVLRLKDINYNTMLYRVSILLCVKNQVILPAPVFEWFSGPAEFTSLPFLLTTGFLPATLIFTGNIGADVYQFYRYDLDYPLPNDDVMIRYTLDTLTQPNWRFFVPSKTTNSNTAIFSCNGYSPNVNTQKFHGSLWFDMLNKHSKIHYNQMLGLGDQIYSDMVRYNCPPVQQWWAMDPIQKRNKILTAAELQQIDEFFLLNYIEWFGYGYWIGNTPNSQTTQGCFPITLATIPSVNMWDDHDTIDGFGSYPNWFQKTNVFSNLGQISFKYYMLFQHHVNITNPVDFLSDEQWVLGVTPGPYVQQLSHSIFTRLGPDIALLSADCRTERTIGHVLHESTYDVFFNRLTTEFQSMPFTHLYVVLGVPVAYPRLIWLLWIFGAPLASTLKWFSKRGLYGKDLTNKASGELEILSNIKDQWVAFNHWKERNRFLRRLQHFAKRNSVRVSLVSGDAHLGFVGRLYGTEFSVKNDAVHDWRLMFNVVSSAIVNAPVSNGSAIALQKKANKPLKFDGDTAQDVVPLFDVDALDNGVKRTNTGFYNKRNWGDLIPAENVIATEYIQNILKIEPGKFVLPRKISEDDPKGWNCEDEIAQVKNNIPYEITDNCIIATLHVEKDTYNINSETSFFSTPIPELARYFSL
ncbi:hypothetical protein Kpol_513p16 [Vanderwaltozyma polyspora DSM 70294]|uniref:PhoD-like phosphatase domain-containing protein n=1 Tax=Vanderwaltozyma polyspora (strain ATCC 22028 / DSM 70294 / BCRC 21397 / CBS 2163 / NBRC 10782 / NRRL Y-8283 / UCD 57-17) TaxID=436907 RepID=A7TMK2_VANPO|nr:uncharacterized protein Kpol_513p16 [Vanderwaltozyma polyspora DSM 70294]EDO16500.1 hypothetical protein Kpol_513p16 [Vanderwaltozyma polyspora DSM 70294]